MNTDNKEEKEIDLQELGEKLWNNRVFIIKSSIIGIAIGIVIAISMPREYTSSVVIFPDNQSSNKTSMGSLAALAGINLQDLSGAEALSYPELYPEILYSTPFLQSLTNIRVKSSKDKVDTILYLYMNDCLKSAWWTYIIDLPSIIKKLISSEDILEEHKNNKRLITKEEHDILESLMERVSVQTDKKTNVTTIKVRMQDPKVSAFLADTLAASLQDHIIKYRTQKSLLDIVYSERLYEEAQATYYEAQKELASFIDANVNIISARYKANQEKLQNEVNLSYSLYNQMAQQLQMAKIKEQNTKPFFIIIQPAIEPLYPDSSRVRVTLIIMFLSIILALGWIFKDDVKKIIFN